MNFVVDEIILNIFKGKKPKIYMKVGLVNFVMSKKNDMSKDVG
jgi:hypothetical protein